MNTEEKQLCQHCGEEIETRRNIVGGKVVYEIPFEFTLKFYRFVMMPISHGIRDEWEVDKICRKCVGKIKALLLENGFKINDISSVW